MFESLNRAIQAAIVFACHTLLALLTVACMLIAGKAFEYMFSLHHEPMVVDQFPVRYLFEIGEVALIFVFIVAGLRDAWRTVSPARPPELRQDEHQKME